MTLSYIYFKTSINVFNELYLFINEANVICSNIDYVSHKLILRYPRHLTYL